MVCKWLSRSVDLLSSSKACTSNLCTLHCIRRIYKPPISGRGRLGKTACVI